MPTIQQIVTSAAIKHLSIIAADPSMERQRRQQTHGWLVDCSQGWTDRGGAEDGLEHGHIVLDKSGPTPFSICCFHGQSQSY